MSTTFKNIDVDIPRDEFVVLTGLSGSGKSSLAFDTIYAEGQRRYMESLSSYARQFFGQMEKPNVEKIEGLSPAITRWWIRSWHSRSGRKSSFSRRLCAAAREDTKRCSNRRNAAAMSA